jgi:hypothetical protein
MASRHCCVGVPCSSTVAYEALTNDAKSWYYHTFSAPAFTPTLALAQLFLTVQNDMVFQGGMPGTNGCQFDIT